VTDVINHKDTERQKLPNYELQIQAASFVVFTNMRQGKRRLLLIDDPPDNLEFLTGLLCNNYEVFNYGSSREARLVLAGIVPDLLFLDVRMFPINGVNFLREIRAIQRFCGIPAIAVTAMAHEVERQALLAEGFQAIVTKPTLDASQLKATINALLKSPAEEYGSGLDGPYPVAS
jgi:CheY-like chemotaxis protein